jgi:hypothetical protein
MKIRPVGAELFHADGRIDIHVEVAFRNFENSPKEIVSTLQFPDTIPVFSSVAMFVML